MTTTIQPRGELLPYKDDFYLWSYVPSLPAAIIFLAIFLGLSIAHSWKMWRHRMWFCIPFVVGGYLEVVGFIGRIAAHNGTNELLPYILQSVFLLVPPSLFAASIYMTLGRIMKALGPRGEACSIIRVRWLTTTFVVGDVFSFLIQGSGAGLMAAGNDPKMGEITVVAGLVIQIIFFGLFVTAAVIFHYRYQPFWGSWNSIGSGSSHPAASPFDWESMLYMLYSTSALILARCTFRIIEYIMGADAYLLKNEWTLYVFDAFLMAATMLIFYLWYPSQIRGVDDSSNQDGIVLSENNRQDNKLFGQSA